MVIGVGRFITDGCMSYITTVFEFFFVSNILSTLFLSNWKYEAAEDDYVRL
jgi:hypothetical protein